MNKFDKLFDEVKWHWPPSKSILEETYHQGQLDLVNYFLETGMGRVINGKLELTITEKELTVAKEQLCLNVLTAKNNQKLGTLRTVLSSKKE